jgi:hypothetical protein
MERLRQNFYNHYDPSFFTGLFRSLSGPRKEEFIKKHPLSLLGEGSHFQAWKVTTGKNGTYVLRIPSRHSSDLLKNTFLPWIKNMKFVSKYKAPLLPPFEIIKVENQFGLVSPYGELLSEKQNQQLTFLEESKKFSQFLRSLGLSIQDRLQIAFWRDQMGEAIPFVFDLSDLTSLVK